MSCKINTPLFHRRKIQRSNVANPPFHGALHSAGLLKIPPLKNTFGQRVFLPKHTFSRCQSVSPIVKHPKRVFLVLFLSWILWIHKT